MRNKLAKLLDECLARTGRGESVDACLADYPGARAQLEPLLRTAMSISAMPKAAPSDSFRRAAKGRLMARLRQEANPAKVAALNEHLSPLDELAMAGQRFWQAMVGARRIAVPVTLALVLLIAASLGASNFMSPAPALAAQCTLSIFSGHVEVQAPGEDGNQNGTDGMTLSVGTHIKTAADSRALLTFFDGSTLELEPGTDIEIQQLDYTNEETINIVLKQWVGRTWSRVVKMVDAGSHYKIETPSACAIVRGTLFTTEVDEAGTTTVATTRGLVSVVAQGEEVYLPANVQTSVSDGQAPSQPMASPRPSAEIIINIDTPAIGSIINPNGASTGELPDGTSFNQIPGSQSSLSEGTQVISLPQPESGEYMIVLRYLSEGTAYFNIQGKSEDRVAFDYTGNYDGGSNGWVINLNLHVADGLIVAGELGGIEPLTDQTLEKLAGSSLVSDDNDQGLNASQASENANSNSSDNAQNAGQASSNANANSSDKSLNAGQASSNANDNSGDKSLNAGQASSNANANSSDKSLNAGQASSNANSNSSDNAQNAGQASSNANSNSSDNAQNAGQASSNANSNGNTNSNR
jgi:hypothetical protein